MPTDRHCDDATNREAPDRRPAATSASQRAYSTVSVLGVPIACLDLHQVLGIVVRAVDERRSPPLTVAYANAHTCNLAWADPVLRSHLERMDLVYVDGNGPRIAAWLQGRSLPRRMTGADWIHDLCAICVERGFGLFLLGAPEGVAGRAADRLCSRHPGLQVRGSHCGYISDADVPAVLRSTAEAKADIILVGMRSPEQERWIIEHASALGAPVVWGTGGMLEYVSGNVRRPPRWMRRLALEWLGRMLIDPAHLARRYVLGVPAFLVRAIAEGIQAKARVRKDTD